MGVSCEERKEGDGIESIREKETRPKRRWLDSVRVDIRGKGMSGRKYNNELRVPSYISAT